MIFVHLVNCEQPDVLQTIVVSFLRTVHILTQHTLHLVVIQKIFLWFKISFKKR